MRIERIAAAVVLVAVVAAAIYLWRSQQPLIDRVEPPPRAALSRALIDQGAQLAAIGGCHACHTAADGVDYAGNRPIRTPFGAVYSTNITPAPGSGIGRWSQAAFRRALRAGFSRQGRHLYPVFPYVHFARLSDADIDALYAFLMTRQPVETTQEPNQLPFPLDQRWLISFWNLMFFHPAPFRPDPRHDGEWNRGAYLVEGPGHCGDCHTPRNFLGAEESGHKLAGGVAEGWSAPALDAASPAPAPWTAEQLYNYLRRGWDSTHGAAAGPMQPVVEALARADPADVRAIAAYLAAQQVPPSTVRRLSKPALPRPSPAEELGAALFAGACARCHLGGEPMLAPHGIDLARSTAINEADPDDAILIVLGGIRQPQERAGPFMPGFAGAFSDAQMAALLGYVRALDSAGPAWPDVARNVHNLRRGKEQQRP